MLLQMVFGDSPTVISTLVFFSANIASRNRAAATQNSLFHDVKVLGMVCLALSNVGPKIIDSGISICKDSDDQEHGYVEDGLFPSRRRKPAENAVLRQNMPFLDGH
jgi:hypothetical protein